MYIYVLGCQFLKVKTLCLDNEFDTCSCNVLGIVIYWSQKLIWIPLQYVKMNYFALAIVTRYPLVWFLKENLYLTVSFR